MRSFWKALRQVYGRTAEQRCWVHKTANVLNKMPRSLQSKAKGRLQDIWMAETRSDAEKAFDFFQEAYGACCYDLCATIVGNRGKPSGESPIKGFGSKTLYYLERELPSGR